MTIFFHSVDMKKVSWNVYFDANFLYGLLMKSFLQVKFIHTTAFSKNTYFCAKNRVKNRAKGEVGKNEAKAFCERKNTLPFAPLSAFIP